MAMTGITPLPVQADDDARRHRTLAHEKVIGMKLELSAERCLSWRPEAGG
jgi:hypothetical protein